MNLATHRSHHSRDGRSDDGFSLAELMVAGAITLMLTAMIGVSLNLAQRVTTVMDKRVASQTLQRDVFDAVLRDLQDARPTALCADPPPGGLTSPSGPVTAAATCRRIEENWGYTAGGSTVTGGAITSADGRQVCYYTNPAGGVAQVSSPAAPKLQCLTVDADGVFVAQTWNPNIGVTFLSAALTTSYPATNTTPTATRRIGTLRAGYDPFDYFDANGTAMTKPVTGTNLRSIATIKLTLRQLIDEYGRQNDEELVSYASVRSNRYQREATWNPDAVTVADGDASLSTPSTPLILAAGSGNGYGTATWAAPTDTGGSPITDYRITVYDANGAASPPGVTGNTSRTVTELFTNQIAASSSKWGWWRLEESSGAVSRDGAQAARDLTWAAGITPSPTGVAMSRSATFDGTANGYTGSGAHTLAATTSVTVECWIRIVADSRGPCIRIGGGMNGYALGIGGSNFDSTGRTVIGSFPGVRTFSTSRTLADGWHHLALVIDAAGAPTIYIDGVAAGTFPGSAAITPTAGVYIGRLVGAETDGTSAFTGGIDDVMVHTRALTGVEVAMRAGFRAGASFDGLTNGSTYRFSVAALNAQGAGPSSLLSATVAPGSGYRTGVLQDTPIAYWRLEEPAGGVAADSSGSGYSATYDGTVTRSVQSAVTNSNAVSVAGTGSLRTTVTTQLNATGGQSFSLEAWVNPTSNAGTMAIISTQADDSTARGYDLALVGMVPTFTIASDVAANNFIRATWAANTLTANTWHHLIVTYDGSGQGAGLRMYVNGTAATAPTLTGAALTGSASTTNPVNIGRRVSTTAPAAYSGAIDEIAVYAQAISPQRAAAHYALRSS